MTDDLRIKIEAYLERKLPPEELLVFEQQIALDKELQKEVQLYKEINAYLRGEIPEITIEDTELTKSLKDFFNSNEAKIIENKLLKAQKQYRDKNKKKRRRRTYLSLAAAIAVLILGGYGYFILSQNNAASLFNEYYSYNDLPSVIKRGAAQDQFVLGVLEFQNKNYAQAIQYFEAYEKEETDLNTSFFLYKGVTHLELKKYDEAITSFNVVISSNTIDSSKGLWFKALLYLKIKNTDKSKEVLKKIIEKESNFNSNEAKKILSKLD